MPNLPILLTMGEPAGIGAEIAVKAWQARSAENLPPFALVGDPGLIAARAADCAIAVSIETVAPPDIADCFSRALPVIPVDLAKPSRPGKPDPANAGAVIAAIRAAVAMIANGEASAVVTNPIHKKTLYQAGFEHKGHTEFLAELAADSDKPLTPVMMLASELLKVIPVTIHMPIAEVPLALSKSLIVDTVQIAAKDMALRFGIEKPRIAIAGLNPHAGEDGALGVEDERIITPAINVLRARGHKVSGPHSADTLFHAEARKGYDLAVCMYHDQALIPAKTLAFDSAVNVTLGLPFVRTSPDHGTAFDIAGRGTASPASLIAALKLAASMVEAEQAHA